METLEIYIDGASKGNPGPSGIGAVIYCGGKPVKELCTYIGEATNNIAEYSALIYALQEALILGAKCVSVKTDSQLLYRQLMGQYKVKHPNIIGLFNQATRLISGFQDFCIEHIPREQNAKADSLATLSIKKAKGV